MIIRRKCPKCKRRRPRGRFTCEWCDECLIDSTDEIMRMIGYTVALTHNQHYDDAEETWQAAWNWTMALPKSYPDYAELCDVVSSICPVPEDDQ